MSDFSAKDVAELRQRTGVGMMECKKALLEASGDLEAAVDLLRSRGAQMAAKKAGRATNQGWIGSYIHANGKIGVIVEVLCETDFVAKNEQFQELIRDIAMHIAAMNPQALNPEELDQSLVERERAVFMEQVLDKPENIRGNIAACGARDMARMQAHHAKARGTDRVVGSTNASKSFETESTDAQKGSQPPVSAKPSGQYLSLRTQEAKLARAGRFEEAQVVRRTRIEGEGVILIARRRRRLHHEVAAARFDSERQLGESP